MIEQSSETLNSHLSELKFRIIKSLIVLAFFSIIAFYNCDRILDFLTQPLTLSAPGKSFIFTGITDMFYITVNISILTGLVVAIPYIIWQLYSFLKPGLYSKEKVILLPFLIASPLLFLIGALFAFYLILPVAWNFLLSFELNNLHGDNSIYFQPRINEYIGTVFSLLFAFGLAFQLPLILNALILFGIVGTEFLRKKRRIAILLIFCIAAVVTPPDAVSQIALAIPLILLYELSIISGKKLEILKQSTSGDLKDA